MLTNINLKKTMKTNIINQHKTRIIQNSNDNIIIII